MELVHVYFPPALILAVVTYLMRDLKADYRDLKNDIGKRIDGLKKDHADFKSDIGKRIDDLKKDHADFKGDIGKRFDGLQKDHADLAQRLARVEALLQPASQAAD